MLWDSPEIEWSRLAELLRRTGMMLHAGVDARRVWSGEAERSGDFERPYIERIRDGVAGGQSLAESMAGTRLAATDLPDDAPEENQAPRGDGFFPTLAIELVDVGERSGRLDAVLMRLAEHYEHLATLRNSFLQGLVWPGIQLALALGVVGLLIWISGMLDDLAGKPLDLLGIGLRGPTGLAIYGGLVLGLACAAWLAWMVVARGWTGSGWLLQLAMRAPGLGPCLESMALARFCWSLAMAHESGMSARRTAALALRSTENQWYTRHAAAIDARLAAGGEFHEAFRDAGVFPGDLLHTLETAEQAGQITESLVRLADMYQQQAKDYSVRLTTLASWLAWALVAAFIVLLIFRMALWYVGQLDSLLKGIK